MANAKWGKGHRATASGDKSPPLHICKVLADESKPGKLPKTLLLSSASLRQDKLPCIKFYPKDKMLRHVNGTDWRVALSRIGFASLTWQQVTTWEREGVGVKDAYFTCSSPQLLLVPLVTQFFVSRVRVILKFLAGQFYFCSLLLPTVTSFNVIQFTAASCSAFACLHSPSSYSSSWRHIPGKSQVAGLTKVVRSQLT